jgi:hypothetical protein
MKVALVALIIFLLNIPFGYWRASVKKFSLEWMLSIHIPVPFIIAFRIISHLGWQLYTFPILISAFFVGQFVGGRIFSYRKTSEKHPLTSCLVWDIVKEIQKK